MFSHILFFLIAVCQVTIGVVLLIGVACNFSERLHKAVWDFAEEHPTFTTVIGCMMLLGYVTLLLSKLVR